ncbi:hypothetical protein [Kordiimonas marina]|uniref:hypothetical protein n=1 Tax=Kordiimonas marina TaxID=2872312 RepID=UPI001FF333B9|nr:hypothetical protein [Kordiimonas marina]MCJ9428230.1 hypothetical protein [Kordiimonas marina]
MSDTDDNEFSYANDAELVGQFLSWTEGALTELRELTDGMAEVESKSSPTVERVYDLAHNIKGMGASFDYSLMTEAGASLCNYIKKLEDGATASRRVIDAHVRVFEVVIQNKIRGDGGPSGQALIDRLAAMIAEERG